MRLLPEVGHLLPDQSANLPDFCADQTAATGGSHAAHGHGLNILLCGWPDGPQLGSDRDATELTGNALSHDTDRVLDVALAA
ncbi:MAG TPA: hypothetical protein VIM01_09700 [Dermatophilaceae bacterium]